MIKSVGFESVLPDFSLDTVCLFKNDGIRLVAITVRTKMKLGWQDLTFYIDSMPYHYFSQSSIANSLMCATQNSESEFHPEFEQLIDDGDGDTYFDPTRHDLTNDRHDPEEDWNRSKRRELFCFHCNRKESHAPAVRYPWQYSFLIGLTLGMIRFVGPYFCRCCGHSRLFGSDGLNPKYWLHQRRLRIKTRRRKYKR